jgi:hypothetical protein
MNRAGSTLSGSMSLVPQDGSLLSDGLSTKRERGTTFRRQRIQESVELLADPGIAARRRVRGTKDCEVGNLRFDGSRVVNKVDTMLASSFYHSAVNGKDATEAQRSQRNGLLTT